MAILNLYSYFPIKVTSARGPYIFSNRKKYFDSFSGLGVNVLGHSHPELVEIFYKKMNRFIHLSNFFLDDEVSDVANILIKLANFKNGKVFFTNSGAEAVELALKTIKKQIKNKWIIYFTGAFHGRTIGALSVSGIPKIRTPFEPLLPHTKLLRFNDAREIENFICHHANVGAVILESIQGSGGVIPLKKEFADTLNYYHQRIGYFLIADEVQSAFRTGKSFAFQHYDLKPDIICIAKSLGGGLPLGACIFNKRTSIILKPGEHGSTYAPNPVAISGAKYILNRIDELTSNSKAMGELLFEKLATLKANYPAIISEIRGKGLFCGIELKKQHDNIINLGLENSIFLNIINNKIIRLLPYLLIEPEEVTEMVSLLTKVIKKLWQGSTCGINIKKSQFFKK